MPRQNGILARAAALLTTAAILTAPITSKLSAEAAAEADTDIRALMDKAYASAVSYESMENYTFAHMFISEYAQHARTLADEGKLHPYVSDTAAGWRDFYDFAPTLWGTAPKKLFMGSDGYFADGADAVRLNVPYGDAEVEDYYHLIPRTNKELCVLVYLTVNSEKAMRQIAQGKNEEYLARTLRQISRIEGQVYLAFCPSVNTKARTKTLDQSFIEAFRHVSETARRLAPNVSMVYSLGDTAVPGENTVAKFYPGDDWVDAFGVELINDYSRSLMPSPEAAYDRRGEYYDPTGSVLSMQERLSLATDKEMPLLITGCSFPWAGKAALGDYADAMRTFYETLPRACPELTAIFYSNLSSAKGICNLRQNPEAAALYEELLSPPRTGACPLDGTAFPEELTLYLDGAFAGAAVRMFLDGKELTPDSPITEGVLTVYVTEDYCKAKLEYSLTETEHGITAALIPADIDYNGNGCLDFSDVDLLAAYVAKWNVAIEGVTDVNGDGKTNLRDVSVLRGMLAP